MKLTLVFAEGCLGISEPNELRTILEIFVEFLELATTGLINANIANMVNSFIILLID
jgi:hypothetical protein